MEPMKIWLFQSPRVEWRGEEILFPYKKAAALFYYLCVKKSVTREEVIHLLWADGEESAGRKSLREALYQIKKKVGEDFLQLTGQTLIRIHPEFPIWVDADNKTTLMENYRGDFLEGFYVKNCYEFEEWAEEQREKYLLAYLEEVRRHLDLAVSVRDRDRMERYATILTKKDPYNEAIYGHVMDVFAACGDYNLAIKLYYDLRKRLKEDLGMEPGEAIQNQIQQIFQVKENMMSASLRPAENFFGRSQEVYHIHNRISRMLREEEVSSLVVEGEVGVGKTALLEKVRQMISHHRALVFSVSCYESEQSFYLKLWQDIFYQMASFSAQGKFFLTLEEAGIFRSFLRSGGMEGNEGFPVSCMLVEQTVLEVVERLSQNWKIILFVDDIQWIDSLSARLLERCLRTFGGKSFLLISSLRPCEEDGFTEAMEALMRRDQMDRMELSCFSRKETSDMVSRFLPELGVDEEKQEAIYRESGGNALFLTELINLMREKGYTLDIPQKTAHVLNSRLSRLSREENQVLDAMSLFLERTSIEELEVLLPLPRLSLLEELENLVAKRLIVENVMGSEVYYSFRHKLYWEFVYSRQSEGKRRHWHQQIAAYYEREFMQSGSLRYLPMISYHCQRCGQHRKAYQYRLRYMKEFYAISNENYPVLRPELLRGDETVGDQGSTAEMMELAREVVRWEDSSQESKALKMESYYILGRYDIATGAYKEGLMAIDTAIRLARELGEKECLVAGCKQMIFYGIQVQNGEVLDEYLAIGEEALLQLDEERIPEERAVFMRLKALYLSRQGQYEEAILLLNQALSYYESQQGEKRNLTMGAAACYNYLGEIHREQGLLQQACEDYRKGLLNSRGAEGTNGTGQLHANLGQVLLDLGQKEEAREHLNQAISCFSHNDYRWGWDRAEAALAQLEWQEGNLSAARRHCEKA